MSTHKIYFLCKINCSTFSHWIDSDPKSNILNKTVFMIAKTTFLIAQIHILVINNVELVF